MSEGEVCLITNNWTCRRGWDFQLYEAAAEIVECSDVVAPKSQVIPLTGVSVKYTVQIRLP